MKKILVIDDDIEYKESLMNLLACNNKHYNVITASDGVEGYYKAKEGNPDLIILDIMMTRITEGFEILRKFKKDDQLKDIPVIISTGIRDYHKNINLTPDEEYLPAETVLEKPVKPEDFLKAIEENII